MISVSDLVFDYPTKRALFGVSCEIPVGSITAMVGPNGAGKTTLLRCIAGLETPISGAITVAGINVLTHPREARRHVGYLRDLFGLYDDLTVERCLSFHAAANGVAPSRRKGAVEETAFRLGLTDRLHELAGALSRGLRQRLAIGQTIIHKPALLLLDEPASGLDPEARAGLSQLLLSLRAEGMTLAVSSHILMELEDYSTHMLIIRGGRVLDFAALPGAAGAAHTQARRLKLSLAQASPALLALLHQRLVVEPLVSDVSAVDRGVSFCFSGSAGDQHRLLAALLSADISVCALAEEVRSLQDVYLSKVKAAS